MFRVELPLVAELIAETVPFVTLSSGLINVYLGETGNIPILVEFKSGR